MDLRGPQGRSSPCLASRPGTWPSTCHPPALLPPTPHPHSHRPPSWQRVEHPRPSRRPGRVGLLRRRPRWRRKDRGEHNFTPSWSMPALLWSRVWNGVGGRRHIAPGRRGTDRGRRFMRSTDDLVVPGCRRGAVLNLELNGFLVGPTPPVLTPTTSRSGPAAPSSPSPAATSRPGRAGPDRLRGPCGREPGRAERPCRDDRHHHPRPARRSAAERVERRQAGVGGARPLLPARPRAGSAGRRRPSGPPTPRSPGGHGLARRPGVHHPHPKRNGDSARPRDYVGLTEEQGTRVELPNATSRPARARGGTTSCSWVHGGPRRRVPEPQCRGGLPPGSQWTLSGTAYGTPASSQHATAEVHEGA